MIHAEFGKTSIGILLGLISAAAYGLIPLFSLPLLRAGYSVQTTMAYRFTIAAIAMLAILLPSREKILIGWRDAGKIAVFSWIYMGAGISYFYAYRYVASGLVATINFLNPLIVMVIMIVFFHEHFRWRTAIAIAMGISGVALLTAGSASEAGNTPDSLGMVFAGVGLSLLAALCNALYFVGIQVSRLTHVTGFVMTFYVMLAGSIFCLANAVLFGSLQWISQPGDLGTAFLLAIVTAFIANLTLILAIQRIGSTIAAILVVMEPFTAVVVGIMVFGEPFSMAIASGIILIICAVLLVIFSRGKIGANSKTQQN